MKKFLMRLVIVIGFVSTFSTGHTAPVEYVRICSIYGAGFHYIPGTDTCLNDITGDARQQTPAGTWRSFLPYPEGKWVTNAQQECASGKLVKVGTFKSTGFTLNSWDRKQTPPFTLRLQPGDFISKVIMKGGFYDPRVPADRHGVNGSDGLCLRSMDPHVLENLGSTVSNPPYGNGSLPIGCVANSRILNMPAAYSITATAAYPSVDNYLLVGSVTTINGPYTYGSQLVVTTDLGPGGAFLLTYYDGTNYRPLAGTISASVCVDQTSQGQGDNHDDR